MLSSAHGKSGGGTARLSGTGAAALAGGAVAGQSTRLSWGHTEGTALSHCFQPRLSSASTGEVTDCGLLASLLFTVMVPFLTPLWVGVNVT
jgi:hypothetical protein